MDELVVAAVPDSKAAPNSATPTFKSRILKIARQVTAVVFWLYFLIKLFVFDVDVYVFINWLPAYMWIIEYKIFILIGILGFTALFLDKWKYLGFLLYIILFPVIFLFWIIPYNIFKSKSWILAFAIINSAIYFVLRFKQNLILTSLFLLSALALAISDNSSVIYVACCAMLLFVICLYAYRIISVFKRDEAFGAYTTVFSFINKHVQKNHALDASVANVPIQEWTQDQLDKRRVNIESAVIANRIFLLIASKLRKYQSSRIGTISDIFILLIILMLVILAFAFLNMGLYKIFREQFLATGSPSAFTFFYYSFNTFVLGSINELTPVGIITQSVSMLEKLCSILMTAIVISIVLSLKSQRQSEELAQVISNIEMDGRHIEAFIASEYKLTTIEDAIVELEKIKGSFLKFILLISNSLPPK